MTKYNKFIVAAVAGLIAILNSLYGETSTVVTAVIAIAGALGVLAVRNKQ